MFIKSIFTSSFSLLNYIQKLKLKHNKTKYTKTKTHHFYLFNHLFIIPNSSMHSKPIPNILPWPNHVSTKGMFTNFIITIICFIEEGSMNWFSFIVLKISLLQVNLCQKLLFLHQLTHNMTQGRHHHQGNQGSCLGWFLGL